MGADLVCQVIGEEKQVSFTWSVGASAFDSYQLKGTSLAIYRDLAKQARDRLSDVVKDRLTGSDEDVRKSTLELAKVGNRFYKQIFRAEAGPKQALATSVQAWLTAMRVRGEIESLEIVVEGADLAPWNVVYEETPNEAGFLKEPPDPTVWEPFWGVRYNLAGGRRVDPLRRLPWLEEPRLLMVVDPKIRAGLPEDQRDALATFVEARKLTVAENRLQLTEALKAGRPDLMYWLCHADPSALYLDGDPIGPVDLDELLRGDDNAAPVGGLAFLNACQTAQSGEFGSFLEALQEVGLSGVIATEQQTIDTFAGPFGLGFLKALLDDGLPIAEALRRQRSMGLPLGLLYSTFCPPGLRVMKGVPVAAVVGVAPALAGVALGTATMERTRPKVSGKTSAASPLPDLPYRSLDVYDRQHRALFVGRDDDVVRFALVLDDPRTRVMLLHGESGVGKSSFLRAGVIPYLEEECIGYKALRRADSGDDPNASLLFVRATGDPVSQIAKALCDACAGPFPVRRPDGTEDEIDLPELLAGQLSRPATAEGLRDALCADPSLLGRVLGAVSNALPFAPVLIIDQAEEVFTLSKTDGEVQARRAAIEMLRQLNAASGDFKVIVSLRTEYLGRMVDRLRQGARDIRGVREYFLTDFDAGVLADAIRRPTSTVPIPHASEVPFDKYRFTYADGVPEAIARGLLALRVTRQDSVLPLLQVVCTQLHARLPEGPAESRVITQADYDAIGGAQGGMKSHAEAMVARMFEEGSGGDVSAFHALMASLCLQQPDGSLSTALVPADELRKNWKGLAPFDDTLSKAAGPQVRLLRVATLSFGGDEPRPYVSLGHDALAKVADVWRRQLDEAMHLRRGLIGLAIAASIALAMTGLSVWAVRNAGFAREQARQANESKRVADSKAKEALDRTAEAVASRKKAEAETNHSLHLLARQYLADGRDRIDQADTLSALPFLVKALDLESTHPDLAAYHRERLGAFLRSSPKLTRAWLHRTGPERPAPTPARPGRSVTPDHRGSNHAPAQLQVAGLRPRLSVTSWASEAELDGDFEPNPEGSGRFLTGRLRRVSQGGGVSIRSGGLIRGPLTLQDSSRGFRDLGPTARPGTVERVGHVEISGDGRSVLTIAKPWSATGSPYAPGTVRVWNLDAADDVGPVRLPGSYTHATLSRDGGFVAASDDEAVTVFRLGDFVERIASFPTESQDFRQAFSDDSSRLLVVDASQSVHVLSLKTGAAATAPLKHQSAVSHAAFSRDGRRVVTTCLDGKARVWDVEDAGRVEPLFTFPHDAQSYPAALNADGTLVVTAVGDKMLRVWDVSPSGGGKPIEDQPASQGRFVIKAAFDSEGRLVVVSPSALRAEGFRVRVWNASGGKEVFAAHRNEPQPTLVAATASTDGGRVLTVDQPDASGTRVSARAWLVKSGEPVSAAVELETRTQAEASEPEAGLAAVTADSPAGFRVVTIAYYKSGTQWLARARLHDAGSGRVLKDFGTVTSRPHDTMLPVHASFSADGRRVMTYTTPDVPKARGEPGKTGAAPPKFGTVSFWDAGTGAPLGEATESEFPTRDAEFEDGGRCVVAWGDDPSAVGRASLVVLDSASGRPVGPTLSVPTFTDVALATGGAHVVTVEQSEAGWVAHVRDVSDGRSVRTIHLADRGPAVISGRVGKTAMQRLIAFVPGEPGGRGPRVVIAWNDVARLYELLKDGPALHSYEHGGTIERVEVSGDGRRVVTIGSNGRLRVWDGQGDPAAPALALSGTLRLRHLAMPGGGRSLLAVSAGLRLVKPSNRGYDLFAAPVARPPLEGEGHYEGGPGFKAAISDDGRFALLGTPNAVRVWDVAREEPVGPLLKHGGPVLDAAIGANGRLVATASADGLARVWDLTPVAPAVSPIGARPELSPGRSIVQDLSERRVGIGRQIEVVSLDLTADERPPAELRPLAEMLGATRVEDEGVASLDGVSVERLRRELARRSPADSRREPRAWTGWLNDQAEGCERDALWSSAAAYLRALTAERPADWLPHARLARATASTTPAAAAAAAASYSEARRLAPGPFAAWLDREAADAESGGHWMPAAAALGAMIDAKGDDSATHTRRACARAMLDDWPGATEDLQAAGLAANSLGTTCDLAAARFATGAVDRYKELCEALASRVDDPALDRPTAERVARVLCLGGNAGSAKAALAFAKRATGGGPPSGLAVITPALAHWRAGETSEASRAFAGLARVARPQWGLNVEISDYLRVLVLASTGKKNEGLRIYRALGFTPPPPGRVDQIDLVDLALLQALRKEAAVMFKPPSPATGTGEVTKRPAAPTPRPGTPPGEPR